MSSSEESLNFSSDESDYVPKDPISTMTMGLAKILYDIDVDMREQMCAEILEYAKVMHENYRQLRDNEDGVEDVVEQNEIDAFVNELMQDPAVDPAVDPDAALVDPVAVEPVIYGPKTFLEYKYGNDVDNDKKVRSRMRRSFWQNIYTNCKDGEDNVKRARIGEFYKDGDEDYKWEMIKSYHNTDDKAGWRAAVSEAGAFPLAP